MVSMVVPLHKSGDGACEEVRRFTQAMRPAPQLVSDSEVSVPRVLDPLLPVSLNCPRKPVARTRSGLWGQVAV